MRDRDQLGDTGAPAVVRRRAPAPADLGRRAVPSHLWSASTLVRLQREAGNAAVGSVLAQRLRDYNAAVTGGAIGRGTGLSPTTRSPYGPVHVHLIRDTEGLGLVESAFLRFEDRQGPQHIMVDREGNLVPTALSRTGPPELVTKALAFLRGFVTRNCPDVSPEEVAARRSALEEQRRADQARRDALPPLRAPGKAVYTGKQAGLFG